jgi:hypothetical protein
MIEILAKVVAKELITRFDRRDNLGGSVLHRTDLKVLTQSN